MLMLFAEFFGWWYGAGWLGVIRGTGPSLKRLAKNFSISILFKTLLSPWKQIEANVSSNQPTQDRFHKEIDKLISRLVGFAVRSLTLLAAGISLLVLLVGRIILAAVWPCLPVFIPLAVLYSLGIF